MNQTPLNPDAFDAAWEALYEAFSGRIGDLNGNDCERMAETAIRAYLAAALPEVTSVEELDQLPVESVVMDKYGYVYLLDDDDDEFKWSRNGLDAHFPSWGIVLPARVLYRPSEQP